MHIPPVHLYIHVPFCARRCSYCDFAIAVRREVPSDEFVRAVSLEWASWQQHPSWSDNETVETIYFGGGTPSRLRPDAVASLVDLVRATRPVAVDAEITLEANPDDVSAAAAAAWRRAGVNRVSLGVQSFDPVVLQWMHRTHVAEQIAPAMERLRDGGIDNLSLDLIFAVPASLRRDWAADLARALELGPDHLSLYGLTIEPHTALGHWEARSEVRRLDDGGYAADFLLAHDRLESHGFEHYEVSNAARPGRRARHNSAYWRRVPFIGLGPSAHSGFGAARRWNIREWAAYAAASERGDAVLAGQEDLNAPAVRLEELYLGLRTSDGIDSALLPDAVVSQWVGAGWASRSDRVRLTPEGWLRLDALVAAA